MVLFFLLSSGIILEDAIYGYIIGELVVSFHPPTLTSSGSRTRKFIASNDKYGMEIWYINEVSGEKWLSQYRLSRTATPDILAGEFMQSYKKEYRDYHDIYYEDGHYSYKSPLPVNLELLYDYHPDPNRDSIEILGEKIFEATFMRQGNSKFDYNFDMPLSDDERKETIKGYLIERLKKGV